MYIYIYIHIYISNHIYHVIWLLMYIYVYTYVSYGTQGVSYGTQGRRSMESHGSPTISRSRRMRMRVSCAFLTEKGRAERRYMTVMIFTYILHQNRKGR